MLVLLLMMCMGMLVRMRMMMLLECVTRGVAATARLTAVYITRKLCRHALWRWRRWCQCGTCAIRNIQSTWLPLTLMMQMVAMGRGVDNATATGCIGATESAYLQDLAATQHFVEYIVGNGRLAAVHVLHEDLYGTMTQFGRKHNVKDAVGRSNGRRLEHGGEELTAGAQYEFVRRDAYSGNIRIDATVAIRTVQHDVGEFLIPANGGKFN